MTSMEASTKPLAAASASEAAWFPSSLPPLQPHSKRSSLLSQHLRQLALPTTSDRPKQEELQHREPVQHRQMPARVGELSQQQEGELAAGPLGRMLRVWGDPCQRMTQ